VAPERKNRLLGLVLLVDLCALWAWILLPGGDLSERALTIVLLAALGAMAGARPVRISALGTEVAATHPFIFCALGVAGPAAAGLVAFAGLAGAVLAERRVKKMHLAFNVGAVALATAAAAWAFLTAGGAPGASTLTLVWPLTAAAAVYFIANTGLVAVVISMEKGERFGATWQRSFRWTTAAYFTGLSLAVALLVGLRTLGPWGLALGVPPCWLLAAFYRAYKDRQEEHARRIREVEALNADLERRVEERTRELREALGRIEELQQLKETLTQTLVHDLKNPLTTIVGNLDLLEQRGEEQTLRLVRRSKAGASRLLRMILDLLDISRLEEGRFALESSAEDVLELARGAIEDAEAVADQREIELRLEAPHPLRLEVDAGLLRRVLDNLIANAVRHSPARGVVTVRVAHGPDGVELSVADQGNGIPSELREKVFEKYARLEVREARVTSNRGLGLTFCQLAVSAHGGTIRADEAEGGGALFRVTLPERLVVEPEPEPVGAGV
jgi:signal transduction histidine kinase